MNTDLDNSKLKISIVGASGYTGGELLRILIQHPHVEIHQVTSESNIGKYIHQLHPNLRGQKVIQFSSLNNLTRCDLIFLCMPHGESQKSIEKYKDLAPKIIDLSADFRLNSADQYKRWYKDEHQAPNLLTEFVYGLPEIHRDEIKTANYVSGVGCNATAMILPLYPLFRKGIVKRVVAEAKVGACEGGNKASYGSHYPERAGSLRSYAPTGHRHVAEMIQELGHGIKPEIYFSVTAVNIVRGILGTIQIFLNKDISEIEIRKIYRGYYGNEPFIRIVKENKGIHRYPDPKILSGTNFCDIGFEKDSNSNRLVVISAIDNLMKGAAGSAVQCMNLMLGFEETEALKFPGLHPI